MDTEQFELLAVARHNLRAIRRRADDDSDIDAWAAESLDALGDLRDALDTDDT